MSVDPAAPDYQEVANFVERNAAIWGARRDVVARVEFAVQQAVGSGCRALPGQGTDRGRGRL